MSVFCLVVEFHQGGSANNGAIKYSDIAINLRNICIKPHFNWFIIKSKV